MGREENGKRRLTFSCQAATEVPFAFCELLRNKAVMSADTSSAAENEPIASSAIPKWHPAKSPDGQLYLRRFFPRIHSACQMSADASYRDANGSRSDCLEAAAVLTYREFLLR